MRQFNFFKSTLILLISVTVFSCKKDSDPNTPQTNFLDGLLKMEVDSSSFSNSGDTLKYLYDSVGRLKKLYSDLPTTSYSTINYTYLNNTIKSTTVYKNGNPSIDNYFYLNSNNNVDSSLEYNRIKFHTYNNLRQLVKIRQTTNRINFDSAYNYSYDTSGNVTSYKYTNAGVVYTKSYTFLNKPNSIKDGFSYQVGFYGTPIFTKLIQVETQQSNGTTNTTSYSYTFDSNNRVTTKTTLQNGVFSQKTFYFYY